MAKRSILGSRAIVTGASSGIGKEIALELCRQGALVAITARREDRLQAVVRQADGSGGKIIAVGGDISQEPLRKQLLDRALAEFGGLDILVNNAGIGATGLFASAGPERLRADEMARRLASARRQAVHVLRVPFPSRAFREGAMLPAPTARIDERTYAAWLDSLRPNLD